MKKESIISLTMNNLKARKLWVCISLLFLSAILIVSGFMSLESNIADRDDIKLYNQAISIYNLPVELLAATENRPEEYPITRAVAYFEQAISETTDDKIKALALYNLGTIMGRDSLSRLGGAKTRYGIIEAIDKLTESIILDPYNENAKYNLEVLEKFQRSFEVITIISPGSVIGVIYDQEALDRQRDAHMIYKGY